MSMDSAARQKRLLDWALFAVPLLYLATIWVLQPEGQLGYSLRAPALGRLLYDDYDATAYAMRGLNAEWGRRPGRLTDPCQPRKPTSETGSAESGSPFYLEYPPAALALFRLPYWLPPRIDLQQIASEFADACHNDIVEHLPRTPEEETLWRKFRQAVRVYNSFGVGCLLALMLVIRAGYIRREPAGGALVLLVLPMALYFSANRFDVLPALLVALSLMLLGRERMVASAICLGLATAVKVYPGIVGVLVIRFLMGKPRSCFAWLATFMVTMAATIVPLATSWGWDATLAPFKIQLSRTLEAWTFYGLVLPIPLGGDHWAAKAFRIGIVLATLSLLAWRKPHDMNGLLRRSAVALIVFASVQVFYSPQWVLWLSPFLVPLAAKDRAVFWLTLSLDLITYLTFPVVWDFQFAYQWIALTVLTYGRAVVLGCLMARLIISEYRHVNACAD